VCTATALDGAFQVHQERIKPDGGVVRFHWTAAEGAANRLGGRRAKV